MARRHEGLPKATPVKISRSKLLNQLAAIDVIPECRNRVLRLETAFQRKIDQHITALPPSESVFQKFNTSPYVLLIHARQRKYTKISELEADILPAKQFSSMETSAGRMVEEVVLPEYGWECVLSSMQTTNSALDGKCKSGSTYRLATLKSGPRCLNDEMSENFADAIITNCDAWAHEGSASRIEFTYGVLYGTQKQSNKKDWHILRNIKQKQPDLLTVSPNNRWNCEFSKNGITVTVFVKIGLDWWRYLGGEHCFIEVFVALIRACINSGYSDPRPYEYAISDLSRIVDTSRVREDFNVSLLQRSQIPWLFLMARHFCDELID